MRFRADPHYGEIDSALERRHEIPYSRQLDNGMPSTGVIDLVYRGTDMRWRIVDYKTDEIQDDAQFTELVEKYTPQIIRYRESFMQLLSQPAETWLCFLNYTNQVRWEQVQQQPFPRA